MHGSLGPSYCTAALVTEAMDLNLAGCIPENGLSGLNMQFIA